MKYALMLGHRVRKAVEENWPVVLPVGVLEYHGEHLCLGVDTLLVERAVAILESEMDLVVLPTFYYGAASYAVAPPEETGSIQINAEVLSPFAGKLFENLLRIGFRNVHVFYHHQSENYVAGMPTDLAFKMAARQVTLDFLEQQRGEGWWGDSSMESYYADNAEGSNPINWIQVHPLMNAETQEKYPIDHAGEQETSLMMALCPEGVDMGRHSAENWYAKTASKANLEYGTAAKEMILAGMREILRGS